MDLDEIFEEEHRTTISEYIKKAGWEAFRKSEAELLDDVLHGSSTGKVIACGGGVVELESNRVLLKSFREHKGPVIHVIREKDAVLAYLRTAPQYPPFLRETAVEAWDRREALFRECCSFEFVSLTVEVPPAPAGSKGKITPDQTFALKPVEEDFFRLLRFIHGVDTNKVQLAPRGPRTYFLSLTFDDIRHAIPILEDLSLGIDLWELRVDLLASFDPTFIAFQVATLRRYSPLPILYTLRTIPQGGKYPELKADDETAKKAHIALLHHALRLGVEYIDLEVVLPESIFTDLVKHKGNASVLASYQDWKGKLVWTSPQTRQLYDRMVHLGADIVKIANTAKSFEDNMTLRQFVGTVERGTPLLAINMGPEVHSQCFYSSIVILIESRRAKSHGC